MDIDHTFQETKTYVSRTALLESTLALLEWDERTGLPSQGGAYRAEQITHLSGLIHRRRTAPELGAWLQELSAGPLASNATSPVGATIAKLFKDYKRHAQLPIELVEATSRAVALGQQAWEKARELDSWNDFAPHLKTIFDLRREEAQLLCERPNPDATDLYDALLDQYEEGARTQQLTNTFAALRDELVPLVSNLTIAPNRPTGHCWQYPVPVDRQRRISKWIAEQIGYDFSRGRLDETTHPFCTTLGPNDCRILTRYQEKYFPSGFYGTLHEAGHGIYEQGLPDKWYGLPPGAACSLGIHESQSRLWENFVGRSFAFWRWCFPLLAKQLNGAWKSLSAEHVYRDVNLVAPSLIRVEADEVTYNLHILIRFELEQSLLSGELSVADAPDAWNERYQHYLGIRPSTHRDGILQDVHWSAGLIGYFPTYTLGNLYAAQLVEAAERQLGPLTEQFTKGDFNPMLSWLRENVHAHGRCQSAPDLMLKATGQQLNHRPFVKYLSNKLAPIYE
ncbi:MAG: carboxypeptidase M32 [Planctomycetales bacterium]|nr:carboxypeptidase M32 [Planctomycetales bacterium]